MIRNHIKHLIKNMSPLCYLKEFEELLYTYQHQIKPHIKIYVKFQKKVPSKKTKRNWQKSRMTSQFPPLQHIHFNPINIIHECSNS